MNTFSTYNELGLIERPAIAIFKSIGYTHLDCYNETFGEGGALGRETSAEVVLKPRLRQALINLNPSLPSEAIDQAIEELTRDLLLPKLISGEIDVEEMDTRAEIVNQSL